MPTIHLAIDVDAPQSRCFDLARCVEFHTRSMSSSGERAVAGVTSGLLSLNDQVTWEARHFGIRQRLTSRITALDAPHLFVDEQVAGAFKRFRHEHCFEKLTPSRTRISDTFEFESPFGPLGVIANAIFLSRHMTQLLRAHQHHLKSALETPEWRNFLPPCEGAQARD